MLDKLDMTVRRGDIYGLLGASGCGKTSLLSVMVGRRGLDSGTVTVLGGRPGGWGARRGGGERWGQWVCRRGVCEAASPPKT